MSWLTPVAREVAADQGLTLYKLAYLEHAATPNMLVRYDAQLKKIGTELVVRVEGQKRTIMLPPALADWRATGARFADGALQVTLDDAARLSPTA